MTTKRQANVRLSPLTERQLTYLAHLWGVTKSEAIRMCVDRVYERERDREDADDGTDR